VEKEANVRLRFAFFGALVSFLLALYVLRPDWAQAAHWWPMLFCTPLVMLPFLSLRPRALFKPFLLALALWCLALHLIREPSALVLLPPARKSVDTLRVVSLNCAGGSVEAAQEAFARSADVVLLQEVASRNEFVRAARQAGYPYVSWSVDDAVFARRPLADPSKAIDFAAGTIELAGKRVRLVALRLLPPVFRLDLWSLDCWRNYAEDAARRRDRLKELLAQAGASGICLVGGDFNATNPRLITDNRPSWSEAGRSVGRGWRGTGTNDFPFVWVDQVWGSPEIRWEQAFAQKTENSDHRMLVADFRL
jgi:endonuclease/exonuclease/phosphatase (EEP) superfamily protein YafD